MTSKGTRYDEEQIIHILKEVESGTAVAEICRKYRIAEQTIYRWRSKYAGLETSELQRLRELESENNRLKKIVAQQALESSRLWSWHNRLKLLAMVSLIFAFLLSLLAPTFAALRNWLFRHFCHRTGKRHRVASLPLYRLRLALSRL